MTFRAKHWENFDGTFEPPDAGKIHLWRTDLDKALPGAGVFPGPLSSAEQERALKFATVQLRQRYVNARTWLRKILGACLQMEPRAVPLVIGEHGKPCIEAGANRMNLRFNLSHSGNFGLLAVTTGCEIGVDVQIESVKNDWPDIAARYFTVKELDHVRALAPAAQAFACVEIWTRKEAAGKALGIGLHSKTFSLSVGPAGWGEIKCGEKLRVWSLAVEAPFAAAVALQG